MNTTRRGFLSLLGAALATPALPAYTIAQSGRLEIIDQDIILKKTLVLSGHHNFLITGSRFRVSEGFRGGPMLDLRKVTGGKIIDCQFIMDGADYGLLGDNFCYGKDSKV